MKKKKKTFSAPKLDAYRWNSSHINSFDCSSFYNKETKAALDTLFAEIGKIAPTRRSGAKELFFTVERGPIEDYADYDEMFNSGEIKNRSDFENAWKRDYPDEKQWFSFIFYENSENGYRHISIDDRVVLATLPDTPPSAYPLDESDFVQWLTEKVKECICSIESGEYNQKVRKELPPDLRFGTITGRAFGEVFPEEYQEYLSALTATDRNEFLQLMSSYDEKAKPVNLLKEMTAGLYLRCCKLGYAANAYEGSDSMPPGKLYKKYADGRDEGLLKIDENSPAAFLDWFSQGGKYGHPWEVCAGGNSTHVSLYVDKTEQGFYFHVEGRAWGRSMETIKFYLALYRAGMPITIGDGKKLAARLTGDEKIGIVPRGIIPRYCIEYFPKEDLIEFMNLPDEKRNEFAEKCVWQELPEVRLIAH